jgi:predicted aspartyl protease
MKKLIGGRIINFVPFFGACLNEGKNLVLSEGGDLSLTVDTGFSGGIALPLEILDEMDLKIIDFDTFRLATGEVTELPVFLGKVFIGEHGIETWFIPGDSLVGMEFLCTAGSVLSLDFKVETVKLMK